MQSASFDSERDLWDSRHQRVTRRELEASASRLVMSVIKSYVLIKALPVVCCCDSDPDATNHSIKWKPDYAHYLADVEQATEAALKDLPELQKVWFAIALGESVKDYLATVSYTHLDVYKRQGTICARSCSP